MSDLTQKEMDHYNQLSAIAKSGTMQKQDQEQWRLYGERYAVQLKREGEEHRARRAEQMKQFLDEKAAWGKARDQARELREEFSTPEPERDFKAWLQLKGLS